MDEKLQALWEKALADIQVEVSKANFHTLFKKTALLSLEQNIATIAAPSTMILDLLQKRFSHVIKQALDKQTKSSISLIFIPKTIGVANVAPSGPLFSDMQEVKKPIGHLPRVRADYTFQNLAVSSSNQLAYVSAQTVAKNIGHSYNPLFIYGPTGVGKTHLMQAIANEVYLKTPDKKILYLTSEEFTNEVVEAIRSNDTARMKKKFRSAHLLIIDDVQFLAGKDRVQEELFHTFNVLIDNEAQIILSSDRPPSEIKKLESRLSSRFAGGLTVDVEEPDFELKTAILLIKAKKYNIELPIDVAKLIAQAAVDTRSLEGLLLRVITQASTTGEEATVELAAKALKGQRAELRSRPDDVIKHVCEFYNIKPTQLKGPKRDAALVRARQITMYLLKKEQKLTYVEIGNLLGGRDHTTVMYGVEKVEQQVAQKQSAVQDIVGITQSLRTQ
ncbi:MAG TPA: chromosomal replication initiator protein DnaA [Candidatus Saccharimonadales bacterium]|nr:chromosomal replication initiator protein DnaA [Candidatus Saccharimonadales bacterium]